MAERLTYALEPLDTGQLLMLVMPGMGIALYRPEEEAEDCVVIGVAAHPAAEGDVLLFDDAANTVDIVHKEPDHE